MFEDLFNFAKTRTLKQSVGFYIFYAGIFFAGSAIIHLING